LHPFASAPSKAWPVERFVALAHYLEERHGLERVIVGGAKDDFSAFADFDCLRGAALGEVKSLLARARLFAGNDSGPAHMAAALRVPAVLIFKASDPAIWGPWRTASEVVMAPSGAVPVIDALARLRVAA